MLKSYRRFRDALRPSLNQSNLATILRELAPEQSLEIRIRGFRKLMDWIRMPARLNEERDESTHINWKNVRYKFLLQFMEHNPSEKEYFTEFFRTILSQGVATRLYCMTGVAENSGFWTELTDRSIQKLLPQTYSNLDLADFFRIIFTEREDAEWFEASAELIVQPLMKMVNASEISISNLRGEIDEALIILGAQIASLGVSRPMRRRLKLHKLSDLSFVKLNRVINTSPGHYDLIVTEISQCYMDLKEVRNDAESTGVSVHLVYTIERLSALLQRIEMLIILRSDDYSENKSMIISNFIGKLIRDEIHRQGVKEFLEEHLQMLAKKIVERAGEKGDHYIAGTVEEKRQLFWAACGAGVLTAFTTMLKVWIGQFYLPLFIAGLLYFFNYALGFLLMQRWHLALSSKQPAFMASALSRKFEEFLQTKELSDVSNEVRKITVSQIIASIANLLLVIPVVMALDWIYVSVTGEHFITTKGAQEILEKHNLLSSGTLFYAAFTGVLLWFSSVIAGWMENWVVFRNIPQILAESPVLRSVMGKEKSKKFAGSFASTVGATAGNVSIAFLLAFPLIVGKFTGLPLDIRHVTLATGTITLALNTLPWDVSLLPAIVSMMISIVVMGCLNFGVSFYFSIRMAAMARGVQARYLRVIFKYAFTRSQKDPVKE